MSSPHGGGVYTKVLGALLVLTFVTVGISRVDLAWANIVVGVLVAVIKASLVALVFMHLRHEPRWWLGLVLFPLALVAIILFANFADTPYADRTHPALIQIPHAGRPGSPH